MFTENSCSIEMRAFSVLFLNQNCPALFSILTVTKSYQKVSLRMSRYKLTEFSIVSPNHPTLKVRQDLDGPFHIMYTILFDLTSLWAPLLKGRTYIFFFRRAPPRHLNVDKSKRFYCFTILMLPRIYGRKKGLSSISKENSSKNSTVQVSQC